MLLSIFEVEIVNAIRDSKPPDDDYLSNSRSDRRGSFYSSSHPPSPSRKVPRSNLVRRNRLVPLNSDDFLATGFRSRFRRTSFDQFPWVPSISNKLLVEILRNLPELFRRKLDRNPVVRKLSELNGADRKQTGSIGSVAGKQRKQSVPTVRTVDLSSKQE